MLAYAAKRYLNGRTPGYTLLNSLFVRVVVLLVLIVPFPSICCSAINILNPLPVYNSTLPNALTLSRIASFGMFFSIMDAMLALLPFFSIFILICSVVFVMLVASVLFGKPQMVYCRETPLV